jgi:hypothetical protein
VIVTVATAPASGAEFVIVRSMFPVASVRVVVGVADAGETYAVA